MIYLNNDAVRKLHVVGEPEKKKKKSLSSQVTWLSLKLLQSQNVSVNFN